MEVIERIKRYCEDKQLDFEQYLKEVHETKPQFKLKKKIKVTKEGQPCRKCGTPVIKRIPKNTPKPNQPYKFLWYLACPKCRAMFMVENAKVYLKKG